MTENLAAAAQPARRRALPVTRMKLPATGMYPRITNSLEAWCNIVQIMSTSK